MASLMVRYAADESGASAIEYGLVASLIAVAIIGVLGTLGINLRDKANRDRRGDRRRRPPLRGCLGCDDMNPGEFGVPGARVMHVPAYPSSCWRRSRPLRPSPFRPMPAIMAMRCLRASPASPSARSSATPRRGRATTRRRRSMSRRPPVIYQPMPVYYAPAAWTPEWYAYCARKYGSFDARSGTFLGYDGFRHVCI